MYITDQRDKPSRFRHVRFYICELVPQLFEISIFAQDLFSPKSCSSVIRKQKYNSKLCPCMENVLFDKMSSRNWAWIIPQNDAKISEQTV